MGGCKIDGCERKHYGKGYCNFHYQRAFVYGCDVQKPIRRKKGEGYIQNNGYVKMTIKGNSDLQHIIVAEKALGRPIPSGAQIHHIDENKSNNHPSNLIICPDRAYHALLHQRKRALEQSGHADWLICGRCGEYDDPNNMYVHKRGKGVRGRHLECARVYDRALYARNREIGG